MSILRTPQSSIDLQRLRTLFTLSAVALVNFHCYSFEGELLHIIRTTNWSDMLFSDNDEGKRCFHPDIIGFMQHGRHDKLGPLLRGVDVKNALDHRDSTLLHHCAESAGTRYLATFFLKVARIDVDARNALGETPLMLAARNLNFEQVRLLLDHGADVRAKDNNGTSALMIAEYYRNVDELTELFVAHVQRICKSSNPEIAELLLAAGCRVPYRFDAFRNAEITRYMLERGSPVNVRDKQYNGNTPLHSAVEKNDVESARLLLRFGADRLARNRSDSVPFVHAFHRRHQVDFEMLELLLPDHDVEVDWWTERKARSEKMRLHPIFVAADARILELFLRRCRPDLKARDAHGRTPLHYLVENEHAAVWDLLLENVDFEVNARDNAGSTALHLAGALVNPHAARFLLDRGANANALNHAGRSPLLNVFTNRGILVDCRAENYHECIELLLHHGADVQLMDANRESLISHSIHFRSYDLHVPILAHLALLEASGSTPISHFVKSAVMMDPPLRRLYEACKRELEDMRANKVYGAITYFQLLTEDYERIASYAQIEDILYRISCERSVDSYYVRLLRRRLLRAKRMTSLKEREIEISFTSTNAMDVDRSAAGWFDCKDLDLRFVRCCTLETMCE